MGEGFGLFEDGAGGFFLLVGRVAVSAEDAADEAAEVGADVFAEGPVDGDVFVDGVLQLAGDVVEGFIVEALHCYFVGFNGVLKGEFVFRLRCARA